MKLRLRIPYWYLLLGPSLLFFAGALMNFIVCAANHGQMPVLWPGGCEQMPMEQDAMQIHVCMTQASHLKFLADWIVLNGLGVASIGDAFLEAGSYLLWPSLGAWLALICFQSDREF